MEPEDVDSDLEIQGEYENVLVFAGFEDLSEDERSQNADDAMSDPDHSDGGEANENDHDNDDEDQDSDTEMSDANSSDSGDSDEQQSNDDDDDNSGDDNARNDDENDENDEDEDEDDVIKKILANSKAPRTHPPDINIDDFVVDISFHPEQDIIALGTMSGDTFIYKYSVEENTLIETMELHTKAIRAIEFNPDGTLLYSTSKDRSILVTDVTTGKYKRLYEDAHRQPVSCMFVIDENLLATGDDDGTIKCWDARDRSSNEIFSLKEVDDYITSMVTNDARRVLVATSGDGYLTALNLTARKLYVQSEPYDEELTCCGLFRNDSKLIVGTSKGRLYTYNWGEFGYHNNVYPGPKTPMSHMIPVTDRVAIVAGEEGILRALNCVPGRNLGVVGQHSLAVDAMDINHSGEYIASSSDNNEVKFWNIKYLEELDNINFKDKQNKVKEQKHNLPSSKVRNAGDFFSDLA